MLADDVSLVVSLVMTEAASPWSETVGLAVAPQVARILHEGLDQLRRRRPDAAAALSVGWDEEIAVARHTVKLLDDNKKTVDSVVEEFNRIGRDQSATFGANNDFAFLESDGRAFASARLTSYQALASLDQASGSRTHDLGESMGSRVIQLQRSFGRPNTAIHGLPHVQASRPELVQLSAAAFADESYEPALPAGARDVAMFAECSVNAALHVFAPAERGLGGSVFRLRFVAATHALSAVRQLLGRFPNSDAPGLRAGLEAVLNSSEAQLLASLRQLRNRSMHYGIPPKLSGMRLDRPGYGLVEATTDDAYSYREVDAATTLVLANLSNELASWRTRRR
ncbi:hypothetical protein [Curtobacterium sp. MCPF17_046]|uniref:hypothetical protein n=1 Tax=Curtobacterium sp. MCPF17_046 TaxID=2175663 RepID=UPI000D9FC392|nr:hypothetical protein [Curtobacterium sp. MCPF17_046]PYY34457.1 hypothetical protein DEJ32_14705 [Curtobacterium sp. MCPF17_046]